MIIEAVTAASLITQWEAPPSWVDFGRANERRLSYATPRHDPPVSQIVVGQVSPLSSSANEDDLSGILAYQGLLLDSLKRLTILEEISSLKSLPPDWGGSDTVLPSPEILSAAKALISSLPSGFAMPNVGPSADGGVGFAWVVENRRVESILDPEGHIIWFWTEGNTVFPGSETEFNGSFPEDLLKILNGSKT